jgi:hypothetical protein
MFNYMSESHGINILSSVCLFLVIVCHKLYNEELSEILLPSDIVLYFDNAVIRFGLKWSGDFNCESEEKLVCTYILELWNLIT